MARPLPHQSSRRRQRTRVFHRRQPPSTPRPGRERHGRLCQARASASYRARSRLHAHQIAGKLRPSLVRSPRTQTSMWSRRPRTRARSKRLSLLPRPCSSLRPWRARPPRPGTPRPAPPSQSAPKPLPPLPQAPHRFRRRARPYMLRPPQPVHPPTGKSPIVAWRARARRRRTSSPRHPRRLRSRHRHRQRRLLRSPPLRPCWPRPKRRRRRAHRRPRPNRRPRRTFRPACPPLRSWQRRHRRRRSRSSQARMCHPRPPRLRWRGHAHRPAPRPWPPCLSRAMPHRRKVRQRARKPGLSPNSPLAKR